MKKEKQKDACDHYDLGYLFASVGDMSVSMIEGLEEKYSARGEAAPGLLPNGIRQGQLTLICAMPGQGKSAFVMSLALELQAQKRSAALFLTEDSQEEFAFKAICSQANVDVGRALRGALPREAWPGLTRATQAFGESSLIFPEDCPTRVEDIVGLSKALEEKLRGDRPLSAIFVDSLNYLRPPEGFMSTIMELAGLARQLKVAVVCTFNLDETPALRRGKIKAGDLRLAGLDARAADYIYFLYRPVFYDVGECSNSDTELHRVQPFVGEGQRSQPLRFDARTLAFSLPPAPVRRVDR